MATGSLAENDAIAELARPELDHSVCCLQLRKGNTGGSPDAFFEYS